MLELPLETAELKTINGHQYYVFPQPIAHTNYTDRPTTYADIKKLETYIGRGSNRAAKLHPDVIRPAERLMTALLDYGNHIKDWSLQSAVLQSGYRPDDESQGRGYLKAIKDTIALNPKMFGDAKFPSSLEADAQSVLGKRGDARRTAFQKHVAEAPGWTTALAQQLFQIVDRTYAPRGFNPHATGFVFDIDFWILHQGKEKSKDIELRHGGHTFYSSSILQSAAGMWLNKYAMQFDFDSYDTSIEVFHLEYRK
jgi:hypothetical protein